MKKIIMNQKGFAQIIILIILIAGLVAAVYLVQKTQIFKPRASFTSRADFIDSNGSPITQTTNRNVRLRIRIGDAALTGAPNPGYSSGYAPNPVAGRDYGDGSVYGSKPAGGFWDDNGPSGPGWYLPGGSQSAKYVKYSAGNPYTTLGGVKKDPITGIETQIPVTWDPVKVIEWEKANNPNWPKDGAVGAKRVFVTSTSYSGDLGGLSGADSKCQAQANEASLGGTFKAWISDSTTSASSRLTHHTGAYKLINGTTVANNWDDLTDGTLLTAINIIESGGTRGGEAWTNTTTAGDIFDTTNTCKNWNDADQVAIAAIKAGTGNSGVFAARAGTIIVSNSGWTAAPFDFGCSAPKALYCFEQ